MPCYKPLLALVSPLGNGKNKVTFPKTLPSANVAKYGKPTPLPCGQCVGCRLERSRQWAIRIMKEARLHERLCFLTLTYSDEHLKFTKFDPPRATLYPRDVQLFLKRLRRYFAPNRLRYFQCGEYGDDKMRPHYHMILFGEDFIKDRYQIENSRSGFPQWESPTLTKLWCSEKELLPMGRCTISDVSFESAAYVARYVLKKISGPGASFILRGAVPEFVTMSRRPGIGSAYFEEYVDEIYSHDEIIPAPGRPPSLPPKYFDRLLERGDPALFAEIKKNRTEGIDFYSDPDSTDTRLKTRMRIKESVIKNCLKRSLK